MDEREFDDEKETGSYLPDTSKPADEFTLPALNNATNQLIASYSNIPKIYLNEKVIKNIRETVKICALIGQSLINRIVEITSSSWFEKLIQQIDLVRKNASILIQSIDYEGVNKSVREHIKQIDDLIEDTLYQTKWIPSVRNHLDWSEKGEIFDILSKTRKGSLNRTKQVDRFIFNHYSAKQLSEMKKKWHQSGLPNYVYRILSQSIAAYNNKQYALTLSSMAMLWEKLIAILTDESKYRTIAATKKDVSKIIESVTNEANSMITQYFNDYIYYNCANESDVIENVPGRNGIVHGWYTKYPTRKSALNAILFTDMLIDFGCRFQSNQAKGKATEQRDMCID